MRTRLTPEDKQYIMRRHREGAPLRQIGREVGRPDITVRRTLEAHGIRFGPARTTNKRTQPAVEAEVVRLYGEGATWKEIMRLTGVTDLTVSRILTRNGCVFNRKPEVAEGKSGAMVALYEAGHSTRAISQLLGHSKSTVNRLIATAGSELRPSAPAGCENPGYFDQIDTPEKAYWLGFITADGCIVTTAQYPEGSHLGIQLAMCDRGHLVKLKEAVGATSTVLARDTTAILAVHSRRLTQALLALGLTPRKSLTATPWDGPSHLMPHYWRGMFDGDGCLGRKEKGLYQAFLCGSEPCVRAFGGWAARVCGTRAKPYRRGNCWYMAVSGRFQVVKITRALYCDAPVSLDRKQEIANRILAVAESANP